MVNRLSTAAAPVPTPRRGSRFLFSPYMALAGVLLVVGGIIWAVVLTTDDQQSANIACPLSPEATESGAATLASTALDEVEPAFLPETEVRVLNANGQSGQAGTIATRLAELGFQPSGDEPATNDALYPAQDLECHGQIRFGEAGEATARSLSMAAPCMELVSIERDSAEVDLALGTTFQQLSSSSAAVGALDRLASGTPPEPDQLVQARAASC